MVEGSNHHPGRLQCCSGKGSSYSPLSARDVQPNAPCVEIWREAKEPPGGPLSSALHPPPSPQPRPYHQLLYDVKRLSPRHPHSFNGNCFCLASHRLPETRTGYQSAEMKRDNIRNARIVRIYGAKNCNRSRRRHISKPPHNRSHLRSSKTIQSMGTCLAEASSNRVPYLRQRLNQIRFAHSAARAVSR